MYYKWHHLTIKTERDAALMWNRFNKTEHIAGAFDTETNGLHIRLATPFLFQFGWVTPDRKGYTYAVDLERTPELAKKVIKVWNEKLAPTLPTYVAHNVKFDLHMLENIKLPYTANNISDTMFYIRYAHDNLTEKYGGPPMGLKAYAAKYVTPSARAHESLLKQERTAIAKSINEKLKKRLSGKKPPEKYQSIAKSYTLGVIEAMFKDPVFTASDLPEDIRGAYNDWLTLDVPPWLQEAVVSIVDSDMIPYNKLNRENVIQYAHLDIVWCLEILRITEPVIKERGNERGIEIENKLIYPLLNMESVGFNADVAYLKECRAKMKAYIIRRRNEFYKVAGEEVKVGQHERIKTIIAERWGYDLESSDNSHLELLLNDLKRQQTAEDLQTFISILVELRTLEKWYAVYITRFVKDLQHTDRLYTTINQVGTVSGRVTSDFQQFPKDAIKTVDGEELFQPRKMIRTNTALVYLDFSQIELRFQALYTILVGHPDLNLCRAYMPYKCVNKESRLFDYTNPEDINNWAGEWYYEEDPTKRWVATDVHGATTKAAFDIDESDEHFHRLRYVGKRVNFAKNYGASLRKIIEMFPEYDIERCKKIDAAYYTAFPGVKAYHQYAQSREHYLYTTNLFGIRYYGVPGHKLKNMLVQGSAAYYLKLKIIELDEYCKAHNIKTKWQMQIHDELSWEWNKEDPIDLFFTFQNIMQTWNDGLVPLVADMEVTTKAWADKIEVTTLDELRSAVSD